jgi:hypothetical protein
MRGLDKTRRRSTIPEIPAKIGLSAIILRGAFRIMTFKPTPSSQSADKKLPCKHPRVEIVSRDEDAEFVECKECGEIFESSEFKDMNIEERTQNTEF